MSFRSRLRSPPLPFLAWVLAGSAPIWAMGAFAGRMPAWVPMGLPFSSLAFLCPAAAAWATSRVERRGGLFRSVLLPRLSARAPAVRWCVAGLLTVPLVYAAMALTLHHLLGRLPPPSGLGVARADPATGYLDYGAGGDRAEQAAGCRPHR
jgi:hypothetical protein